MISRRKIIAALVVTTIAISAGHASAVAYTYITVDEPLATSGGRTYVTGIANSGMITGSYYNGGGTHGFVEIGGVFSVMNEPYYTQPEEMNNSGTVVGNYIDGYNTSHAFSYSNGSISDVAYFAGNSSITLYGISDNDEIVGVSAQGGFAYTNGGSLTPVNDPSGTSGYTTPRGVNDIGTVSGYYLTRVATDTYASDGFIEKNGKYTTVDAPGGNGSTEVVGINSVGDVVGIGGGHGFIDIRGVFTNIDEPLAASHSTYALAVNDSDTVAGYYLDVNGLPHGFIATPDIISVAEPTGIAVFGSGLLSLGLIMRRQRCN